MRSVSVADCARAAAHSTTAPRIRKGWAHNGKWEQDFTQPYAPHVMLYWEVPGDMAPSWAMAYTRPALRQVVLSSYAGGPFIHWEVWDPRPDVGGWRGHYSNMREAIEAWRGLESQQQRSNSCR